MLDRSVAQRVVERLGRAARNPALDFERLVGSDEFKLRIEDDRGLVVLSPAHSSIGVEPFEHRSAVDQR